MMDKKYLFRICGSVLFIIGIALGLLLFGSSTWADLEATFYGFKEMGDERINTIDCPILMTTSDVGAIAATFKNPNDSAIQFMVRADISGRGQFRSESKMISLEPHKSMKVEWRVTSEDVDLGYFIFAQISNFPAMKIPFRHASCGIVVLKLPQFTGGQVFTFLMIVILFGILGGLVILETYGKPLTGKLQDTTRAMKTLGVLVLLGLLVSLQGLWMLGVLLFAASILAIGVIVGFMLA